MLAEATTFLGSTLALVPLSLALVGWLSYQRRWQMATLVTICMLTSLTLTVVLKNAVGRARPSADTLIGAMNTGFSFPSGHTLNGATFFGLLAGVIVVFAREAGNRALAISAPAICAVVALAIGLSRIYLGYHWLSDVLAGWALAALILAVIPPFLLRPTQHRGLV
ncbi:phosphatase PAP2 family protein [Ornithinimicrobium sp. INDO-MA30-4]|uniref:phosphatase PAP2 family protein n=1 Tax=Ornithinimicrobium sp. INDO-MA30-4 TaxID=2908651 RepID=UPI001F36853B|nr:phosphatase PAP2 family protein [Ornithinimicrobium sp. INDO-MA30-4]UJH70355.1 phosphatase PAP2 family protein [Ornithinimicrobium sp. INDO-MA30-4]